MLTFNTKTKRGRKVTKQSIECIDCWEELTVKHWISLSKLEGKELDFFQVFSVFSGIDYKVLMSINDKNLERKIYQGVNWFFEEPVDLDKVPLPEQVVYNKTAIPIPKHFGSKTIGQKFMLNKHIKSKMSMEEMIPIVLAIYLEPEYKIKRKEIELGKMHIDFTEEERALVAWSPEKTAHFIKVCEDFPIMEAYPIASFFLGLRKHPKRLGLKVLNLFQTRRASREIRQRL